MPWLLYTRSMIAIVTMVGLYVAAAGRVSSVERERRIVVLTSSTAAPYKEALAGFQQSLQQQGIGVHYDTYVLEGDAAKVEQTLQEARQTPADLFFTLGTLATQRFLKEMTGPPAIAGLILNPDDLKEAPNATGVVLEFPLEVQFQWLRRFLPTAGTVGVVYNPKENQRKIEAAGRIARTYGFTLEAQEVQAAKDLPVALENLAKKAHVLWGVVDQLVFTSQTDKQILIFSFQNRIPFVGLSAAWVKAGALYALDWDYTDLGMQCGEMAGKVLHGAKASTMPPAVPRKVAYSLNQKTARHMKIDIAEALMRGARDVY